MKHISLESKNFEHGATSIILHYRMFVSCSLKSETNSTYVFEMEEEEQFENKMNGSFEKIKNRF